MPPDSCDFVGQNVQGCQNVSPTSHTNLALTHLTVAVLECGNVSDVFCSDMKHKTQPESLAWPFIILSQSSSTYWQKCLVLIGCVIFFVWGTYFSGDVKYKPSTWLTLWLFPKLILECPKINCTLGINVVLTWSPKCWTQGITTDIHGQGVQRILTVLTFLVKRMDLFVSTSFFNVKVANHEFLSIHV